MTKRIIDVKLLLLFVVAVSMLESACGDISDGLDMAATEELVPKKSGESVELSEMIGSTFTNTNAPDAVLYWHFLQSIYVDSAQPNGARSRLLLPGLTPNSDEAWLSEYFIERYFLMNNEVRLAKREALSCDELLSDPPGNGVVEMVNGLVQVELATYQKHLAISAVQLTVGTRFNLVKAIRNSPSTFQRTFTKLPVSQNIDDNQGAFIVESMCESLLNEFRHDVEPRTKYPLR